MSPERKIQELFAGNPNWHGADWGQAIPEPPDWVAHVHDSGSAIGVSPMKCITHPDTMPPAWMVKWGCIDLDVKREGKRRWDYETEQDAHTAAVQSPDWCLNSFDIVSWIEVTKSHGRHVWVFAQEPVPAAVMRRALLVACMVAEVPPTEVNPKSEGFDDPSTLGKFMSPDVSRRTI